MFMPTPLATAKRNSSITHATRIHANENNKSGSARCLLQRALIQSALTSTATPAYSGISCRKIQVQSEEVSSYELKTYHGKPLDIFRRAPQETCHASSCHSHMADGGIHVGRQPRPCHCCCHGRIDRPILHCRAWLIVEFLGMQGRFSCPPFSTSGEITPSEGVPDYLRGTHATGREKVMPQYLCRLTLPGGVAG